VRLITIKNFNRAINRD